MKKTGFTKAVCKGCAYCKNKKCTIAKKFTDELTRCPEGYTHELIREINEDIIRRFNGLPHGNIFAREW